MRDSDGRTALHFACLHNQLAIAELLLKSGADANAQILVTKRTSLHIAFRNGNMKAAQLLLKYRADLLRKDVEGNTPVHYLWMQEGDKLALKEGVGLVCGRREYKEALKIRNKEGVLPSEMKRRGCDSARRSESAQLRRKNVNRTLEDLSSAKKAIQRKASPNIADLCTATTEIGSDVFSSEVCCAVDADLGSDYPHRTLDSYNILKLIGKGSFGEVFLVEDKVTKCLFAMKIIQKAKIMSQNLVRYVLSEKRVMACTNHAFIVKLRAAFQTRSKLLLIMDYCPGGDLSQHIAKEKKFSEAKARLYVGEVILAIEDLHKRGIIFRYV